MSDDDEFVPVFDGTADNDDSSEYEVHRFMNTTHDFMLGFEMGYFVAWLNGMTTPVRFVLHDANKGEALRLAQLFEWHLASWTTIPDDPAHRAHAVFIPPPDTNNEPESTP